MKFDSNYILANTIRNTQLEVKFDFRTRKKVASDICCWSDMPVGKWFSQQQYQKEIYMPLQGKNRLNKAEYITDTGTY